MAARPPQGNSDTRQIGMDNTRQHLKYDVWNRSAKPLAIPGGMSSTAPGRRGVCTSMVESADALLSRSLLEQCRLDESPGSMSPGSSEASWKSRWWSDATNSNKTSLSTCRTWWSSVGHSQTVEDHDRNDHGNPIQEGPKFAKQQTAVQRCWSHVSALTSMLGSVQGPEPICPPKHDIWALMATARKFQPCLGNLARCSAKDSRKVQSCPDPRTQKILDHEALSPSSASKPVAIPASKSHLSRPIPADESTDTSYTSSDQTTAMKTSCSTDSSPGLLSREEQKRLLLDRLMEHFFAELVRGGQAKTGNGSGFPAQQGTKSMAGSSSRKGATGRNGPPGRGKRPASTDEREGSDNEDNEAPKPKKAKSEETEVRRLACPFFKRNPHKYKDQSKCVGPGWMTVHRLKEHLYRRHMLPIHCYRCREVFASDRLLQLHSRSQVRCALRDDTAQGGGQELEGIDASQERQLRSRRRTDKTEEEKWRDVFRICFPADAPDSVPTPWFELPPAWGAAASPTAHEPEIARYEEFLRRELPRRVRGELEVRIEQELSPVEESLKRQLVDIVRDMQQTLFADFRRLQSGAAPPGDDMAGDEEPEQGCGSDLKGKERATGSESPEDLVIDASTSGISFDDALQETPPMTTGWAASQPIDVFRQPQPFFDDATRFGGVIFDLGQSCGDWSWADSGYMSAAMSAVSSKINAADDDGMVCDDGSIGGQFGHAGMFGEYRDVL